MPASPSSMATTWRAVLQYVAALEGEGSLYEELHNVFDADYPRRPAAPFLARLARP